MMFYRKKKEETNEDDDLFAIRRVGLFTKVGKLGDVTPTDYDPADGPPLRITRTLRGK